MLYPITGLSCSCIFYDNLGSNSSEQEFDEQEFDEHRAEIHSRCTVHIQ